MYKHLCGSTQRMIGLGKSPIVLNMQVCSNKRAPAQECMYDGEYIAYHPHPTVCLKKVDDITLYTKRLKPCVPD